MSEINREPAWLQGDVRLFLAGNPEITYARGRVIGYWEAHTVLIETEDGERIYWSMDLSESAED